MPKLWQYQARNDVLLALPQPIAPNGWEVIAPDGKLSYGKSLATKRATQVGDTRLDLLALLQPIFVNNSFETLSPLSMPRVRMREGFSLYPVDVPRPAVAQNPEGWEHNYPPTAKKKPTDSGANVYSLTLPSPSAFYNPLGFIPQYPPTARKLPTNAGYVYSPQRIPPDMAYNPLGWEAYSPTLVKRKTVDAGYYYYSVTPQIFPLSGWEIQQAYRGRNRVTDVGTVLSAPAFLKVSALGGWDIQAPSLAKRKAVDAGLTILPFFSVAVTTVAGWAVSVLERLVAKRCTDVGWSQYFILPKVRPGPPPPPPPGWVTEAAIQIVDRPATFIIRDRFAAFQIQDRPATFLVKD